MTKSSENHIFDQNNLDNCNAWPFQEARRLIERIKKLPEEKTIVFETGYGPSGLPHIGTFCEVFRTNLVRKAFTLLTNRPSKLICFSDDMDGLRKIPTNVPNQANMSKFIGQPLTQVPDPFETHKSFGEHNNSRLRSFLDSFNFEYEFLSATYKDELGVSFNLFIKLIPSSSKTDSISSIPIFLHFLWI